MPSQAEFKLIGGAGQGQSRAGAGWRGSEAPLQATGHHREREGRARARSMRADLKIAKKHADEWIVMSERPGQMHLNLERKVDVRSCRLGGPSAGAAIVLASGSGVFREET